MGRSQDRIANRLDEARRQGVPVALGAVGGSSCALGYVVGLTDGWVVLHRLLEHVYLDEVVFLRLDQVAEVDSHPHQAFVARAVDGLGRSVAHFELDSKASTLDLLRAISSRGEVVSMSYLDDDSLNWEECGVIRSVERPKFTFHHLGADGVWAPESGLRRLDHVIQVKLGGLYLTALDRFKDADPAH